MQIKNYNSPQFTATHISTAKNIYKNTKTEIQIYSVNKKQDNQFLRHLERFVKIQNLMPNLEKHEYERWQEMLTYALQQAEKPDRITYIAATTEKPCGIITYLPGRKTFHIDCICTWPVEFGKKVKFAGQTLFNMVFHDFVNSKASNIKLEAITDGPYNTVKKYLNLGFTITGTQDNNKILMENNQNKVKKALNTLQNNIKIHPTKNTDNINLNNILNLSN